MGPNMVPQVSVLGNEVTQNGGSVMESFPPMPLIPRPVEIGEAYGLSCNVPWN